jgi:arylsulfatase A-like enzyme
MEIQGVARWGLVGLVACLAACGAEPEPVDERPHVLIVVLDTTRADLLSAYGHEARTSPALDVLAREGALYTRAYSTDFWTLPAHASLFTGRYPSEHGATSETNHFPGRVPTLASTLRAAGYRTAAFVANPWLSVENGFARGFERFEEAWRGKKPDGMHDRDGVEEARRFFREHATQGSPFFAFVNINVAHLPYRPPIEDLHAVAPRARSIERSRAAREVVGMWEYLGGAFTLDDEDFAILRDLYRGDLRSGLRRCASARESCRVRRGRWRGRPRSSVPR